MLKTPLVSILIPLYNAENHFPAAMNSLLAQTYKKIEIIVVDDGSTDLSLNIANKYESLHENIKTFTQKNSGAAVARNKAFKMSTGAYIQYFDADDIMHPEKIMHQIEVLRKYGFKDNIITSGKWACFINSVGKTDFKDKVIYKNYDNKFSFFKDAWENDECIICPAWLIPREINVLLGGWNNHLTVNDDGEFFARVAYNAEKIIYVKESIVYYRKGNPNSLSSSKTLSDARSHLDSLHLYTDLIQNDIDIHSLHKGLATLYSKVYRYYYPLNQSLKKELFEKLNELGYNRPLIIFKKHYILIVKILGIDTALFLSKAKEKFKNWLGIHEF